MLHTHEVKNTKYKPDTFKIEGWLLMKVKDLGN